MTKKLWIGGAGLVAAVALAFLTAYFASPYLAVTNFVAAASAGDRDKLDAAVDFPAVREDFKSQMTLMITTKMQNDPDLKKNPFAGLGFALIPVMVNRVVDQVITPDGLSHLVLQETGTSQAPASPSTTTSETKVKWLRKSTFVTFDRFRETLTPDNRPDAPFDLVFERRGLFRWRLIRVGLPKALMDTVAPAGDAK